MLIFELNNLWFVGDKKSECLNTSGVTLLYDKAIFGSDLTSSRVSAGGKPVTLSRLLQYCTRIKPRRGWRQPRTRPATVVRGINRLACERLVPQYYDPVILVDGGNDPEVTCRRETNFIATDLYCQPSETYKIMFGKQFVKY